MTPFAALLFGAACALVLYAVMILLALVDEHLRRRFWAEIRGSNAPTTIIRGASAVALIAGWFAACGLLGLVVIASPSPVDFSRIVLQRPETIGAVIGSFETWTLFVAESSFDTFLLAFYVWAWGLSIPLAYLASRAHRAVKTRRKRLERLFEQTAVSSHEPGTE
jgi:hypothetical protein